jgi:hypothetical protein
MEDKKYNGIQVIFLNFVLSHHEILFFLAYLESANTEHRIFG